MDSIATIFEYFTRSLNPQKDNFVSPKIWDDINNTFSKICNRERNIDSILEKDYNRILPQKSISFPPIEKIGSYCEINNDYLNKKALDVLKIDFFRFYPTIILNLYEEGTFSITDNFEIFRHIVTNFEKISSILSDDGRICLKLYVNYYFGKLHRDQAHLVVGRGYQIIEQFTEYDGWIYSDTDEIYIRDSLGIEKELRDHLDTLGYQYEIDYFKEVLILGKKKIITINKDSIGKIRGFQVKK